jgi:hypothetical protein
MKMPSSLMGLIAGLGGATSGFHRSVPERIFRNPDEVVERQSAAEAKRARKAAKRLKERPEEPTLADEVNEMNRILENQ